MELIELERIAKEGVLKDFFWSVKVSKGNKANKILFKG